MNDLNEYLFLIPILIAQLLGVMSPGPSFIYVAQTTLSKSRSHGIATSFGMGTGATIFALIACYGLFLILETVPVLYGFMKFIGGAYLLYLAYKIWTSPVADTTTSDEAIPPQTITKSDYVKSYFLGLSIQLSNPKTAIVIGSMIMAFLPTEVPPYTFLLIAVMIFISDTGWYCIVAAALSTQRAQRFYDRFKRRINQLASSILGLMGVKLAFNL